MAPKIGFILLTHNRPRQIIRLVKTLTHMFDAPPITCHHDFSQSKLPIECMPSNFALVRPHLQTGWGKFSVIEATLQALALLYQSSTSPDWVVLLSAADYPIKSAQQILSDLDSSEHDVHIHHEQIKYMQYERYWQELCYKRYCVARI